MTNDINNFRQNHPELVVRDLKQYVEPSITRQILKYRGINKWLRVRRLLISLKSRWLEQIRLLQCEKIEAKASRDFRQYYRLQGYVEALTDCRQQVRALCHSPREVDFPEKVHDFGVFCSLPSNFPTRPHKRWFWKWQGIKK